MRKEPEEECKQLMSKPIQECLIGLFLPQHRAKAVTTFNTVQYLKAKCIVCLPAAMINSESKRHTVQLPAAATSPHIDLIS